MTFEHQMEHRPAASPRFDYCRRPLGAAHPAPDLIMTTQEKISIVESPVEPCLPLCAAAPPAKPPVKLSGEVALAQVTGNASS